MPTRSFHLSDRHATLVGALVESGRYESADEVMREGLRLIERREAEDRAKLEALRAAVQVGIDDIEAGNYREFADIDEMIAYLRSETEATVNGTADL